MQQTDTDDRINITDNPAVGNERQGENRNGDFIFDLLNNIMSAKPADRSSDDSSDNINAQPKQNEKTNSGNSDLLTSLLSNPELLSKLPQLISVIGPLMSSLGNSQTTSNVSSSRESDVKSVAAISSSHAPEPKRNDSDRRSALLCAMKPYLSPERQNAIDYIIKLGKLGDILKTL